MPWEFDTNLSKVMWSVSYLGIATVNGRFTDVQAHLDLESDDPRDWKSSVVIQTASVYSGYQAMDDHLRAPAYLAAEQYPTIEFKSSAVEVLPAGHPAEAGDKFNGVASWEPRADHFRVTGSLTLRGVTRPIELDTWYFGSATDTRGLTRRAFRATTSIRRADFAIYKPPHAEIAREVAGEVVDLRFDILANQR